MAATVSGAKTVTAAVAPHLPASALTTLLSTAIENLTIAQVRQILDACSRVKGGGAENSVIGSLLV